jgi:hypothetical protein
MEEFKPKVFKMEEQIKLGNNVMTVNNCEMIPLEKGFDNPENKFFSVNVTIENQGDKAIQYTSGDFILRDQQGYIYETTISMKTPDLGFGILPALSKNRYLDYKKLNLLN